MIENNNSNEGTKVAVVGVGFRLPSGDITYNLDRGNILWESLVNKFDGIVETSSRWNNNFTKSGEIGNKYSGFITLDEWKSFDPMFFGLNPNECKIMDPQQRVLLKCSWEALEDAKIDPMELRGSNTSVFIGSCASDYQESNKDRNKIFNVFLVTTHSIANRISYCFDLHGESITIDTACSSSLNAINLGYKTIMSGKSNVSIVGGVNLAFDPQILKSLTMLTMLSKGDGRCKSFDADADGYVRSEAVAVVVLKNLKNAIQDGNNIYCVLEGGSSNIDGSGYNNDKPNYFQPSKSSQFENILMALSSTNGTVNASDIDYVEAHGTGTPTGDPIELEAISMALQRNTQGASSKEPLLIGSFKSNVGHSEAASGAASLIKCCLMFKNKCFAPNIHFNKPNPLIKFDEWNIKVVTEPTPFKKSNIKMMINNFGVTGSNCCLLLSQFEKESFIPPIEGNTGESKKKYLIPFSANSVKSLETYQNAIFSTIDQGDFDFNKFVYQQINSKSTRLCQRSIILASNLQDFKDKSNYFKTNGSKSSNMTNEAKRILPHTVFVFCGQGSHYPTMGLELYKSEPVFKKYMDLMDGMFFKHYGYSVMEKLKNPETDAHSFRNPIVGLTMVEIALFELYKHWGIHPSMIVGHSLGELTGAYAAGMIDLETMCYIVYHRGFAQEKTLGMGRMLAINIGEDEFKANYSAKFPSVEIACYNSPSSIVIGGKEKDLYKIGMDLKEKGVFSSLLETNAPFHTSSQEICKDYIVNLSFESQAPKIPMFSTVNSKLIQEYNPQYVYDNMVSPVSFYQTIENIYKHIEAESKQSDDVSNEIVFLEIAPHPTLSYYLKQMIPKNSNFFRSDSISVYSPLHKKKNDIQEFQQTISKLYCQGFNLNFKCQFNQYHNENLIELPLYQWDEQEYWSMSQVHSNFLVNGPPMDHLGFSNIDSPLVKSHESFIDIGTPSFEWLKGHQISSKFYFPGCGYVDNLIKLYQDQGQDIIINSLEFKLPFLLQERHPQYLQTNIISTGKKDFRALFHFNNIDKSKKWVESAVANFHLFSNENDDHHQGGYKFNIDKIISNQCNLTKLTKTELYNHIKSKTGVNYEGVFQKVKECHLGTNCSMSIVSLDLPEHLSTSFFNTSIMDSCLHGLMALIQDKYELIFEKIEGLTFYTSRIPKNRNNHSIVYAYSKIISRNGDSFSSSVHVLLEDGTCLFKIDNAVCTSLSPVKNSLSIEYPTDQLYSSYLQPKDSSIESFSNFSIIFNEYQSSSSEIKLSLDEISNNQLDLVSKVIQKSITPFLNEKMIFRILEFSNSSDCLLSIKVLDGIKSLLLENPSNQIDIEYTRCDNDSNISNDVKESLTSNSLTGNEIGISLIYKSLNLDSNLIFEDLQQGLNPSYYDFVIMSDVLSGIKDIKFGINEVYKVLLPNGNLLFTEKPSSTLNQDNKLIDLLKECNFNLNQDSIMSNELIIQAKKPILLEQHEITSSSSIESYDRIIVFGNNLDEMFKNKSNVTSISNIEQFKQLPNQLTDNSIIYFTKTMNQLNIDNFKEITLEYIQINQMLIQMDCKCKHVLISCNSQDSNYLASSVVGASRFYHEFIKLRLYIIDFDSLNDFNVNPISIIDYLINPIFNIQREFFIKDKKVYYERFKRELKLDNSFKSESFEKDQDMLIAKLTADLDYELSSKQNELQPNQVEVNVMANGVNYKDYLIYTGLIQALDDDNKPILGGEFSGIVTRVGYDVDEFKVGDCVYGMALNCTSSHVIIDSHYIDHKPKNINHVQASAIPIVFLTSYHSLYNIGDLKNDETILLHSATGGVGLSTLQILKWKGHTGPIFVTVGSKEKEQYLLDHYGDMITGIYSTRNQNYLHQIEEKLQDLGHINVGVDLILNTLSSDYLDTNFKCLNKCGRIIDLSIMHLNSNEFINNKMFKYNVGYHNIELTYVPKEIIKNTLKLLSLAIENENLIPLIPITEYSNSNSKDAIEYINTRKHIGKIVINHQDCDVLSQLLQKTNNLNFKILKSNYHIQQSVLGSNVLITGQSGIVLEILKWILKYSIGFLENIIILSKSSMKWEMELLINKEIKSGSKTKFHFKSVDVSDSEMVDQSITEILNENPSIKNIDSIFHYAFVQTYCNESDTNMDHLNISHGAKTMGAINLHNQSIKRNWKLKQFVMASSNASILGSTDQCSYVCANAVLDSLSRYRKSIGLPSICSNYGPIDSSGIVGRNQSIQLMLEGQGLKTIQMNLLLGCLDLQLQNQSESTNLMLTDTNFKILSSLFKYQPNPRFYCFDYYFNYSTETEVLPSKQIGSLEDLIIGKISELLSIEVSRINPDLKLIEYGADSLFVVNFKNWLDTTIDVNIITIQQVQTRSINAFIQFIKNALELKNSKKQKQSKQQNGKHVEENQVNWENEIKIPSDIYETFIYKSSKNTETTPSADENQKCIFLTGTTGFLGAYLLYHLLNNKSSNCSVIYCLIRNKTNRSNPIDEIIDNLKYHQLFNENTINQLKEKVVVLIGDLTLNNFGLSEETYSLLSNKVNLIINAGADLNLKCHYLESKLVNVNGVKEAIKLSITGPRKRLVQFSSISVYVNQDPGDLNKEFNDVTMPPMYEKVGKTPFGYMQSKLVAEYLLKNVSLEFGIESMIIRPPSIYSDPESGIGSRYDFNQLLPPACAVIGYYPDIDSSLPLSPVTWVAKNIINLIFCEKSWHQSKPISSNSLLPNIYNVCGKFQRTCNMFTVLKDHFNCKPIEFEKWKKMVEESKKEECIRYRTIHSLDFHKDKVISEYYSISNYTKSLLIEINSNDYHDESDIITDQMVINQLNNFLKLKIK